MTLRHQPAEMVRITLAHRPRCLHRARGLTGHMPRTPTFDQRESGTLDHLGSDLLGAGDAQLAQCELRLRATAAIFRTANVMLFAGVACTEHDVPPWPRHRRP